MPEHVPTAERIALIDRYVMELVLLTKEQCPDAPVQGISLTVDGLESP